MTTFAITNAVLVLPDRVVDRGTLRVHDGIIVEIADHPIPVHTTSDVLDAQGAYLVPGAIDLHNDSLEFEVNPRPGANLPLPFALAAMERRLVGAGVTTEFHAVAFMERASALRSVEGARLRTRYIAKLAKGPACSVEHHVLHRIDVWHPEALDAVFDSVSELGVHYISLNDHTPGQGQYRNVDKLIELSGQMRAMRGAGFSNEQELLERMRTHAADTEMVPYVYSRVREAQERMPMVIATHDDDSPEKVDAQWELGATVAEFPVTFEAARRARDRGMRIVVGAPNILRGGSQSGNLAASELLESGLADIICADYHAPSLFAAAFKFAQDGLLDLPSAVRMVTLNPASALGFSDRGALQTGLSADVVLLRPDGWGFPHVLATYRRGHLVFAFGPFAEEPVALAAAGER